jgi:hypothetical protein
LPALLLRLEPDITLDSRLVTGVTPPKD